MIGKAKELGKGDLFSTELEGAWRRIREIRRGRLRTRIKMVGGGELDLDNDDPVRFEPLTVNSEKGKK